MKKQIFRVVIILFLSIALTAGLFVHDYYYDDPKNSDSWEIILVVGSIYTTIFFAILFVSVLIGKEILRRFGKIR